MPASNEPRNGDFVAYLEQLQRESAARLLAQTKSPLVQLPAGTARHDHPAAAPAEPAAMPRLQVDELLARLASQRASTARVGPTLGVVFGAALLLYWIAAGSTPLTLLIGIGLVVWSIRRLRQAGIERAAASRAKSEAIVSHVFGKAPGA